MADQFKILFSPIKVGAVTVRNRIVVPGHFPALNELDTLPGERITAYWESKARGGAGMICTGIWGVHPSSPTPTRLDFFDYRKLTSPLQIPAGIDRLKRTAEAIKKHGACFMVQLWHGGAQAYGTSHYGDPVWAPSAVRRYTSSNAPHAMTKDEIKSLVEAFAAEALRAKQAGIDGVEIHGAHGYLFTQFLSPTTNKREDEYGGDDEGRTRFAVEVTDAIRAMVGKDFVVGIRVSVDILSGGGYSAEDMKRMAAILVKKGNLDYMATGAGIPPTYFPLGSLMYHAAALKQVVDIPVIGGGRVTDPLQAEQILNKYWCDMVFMNRALICDPELPNKAREGRLDEIRRCMGDSEGCWMRVSQDRNHQGVSCSYNPTVGKETIPGWLELIPAKVKKRVMVIGGGPAGLEMARVAKARGHDVSLWEKSDDLGGMVNIAAKAPSREDLLELPRYYKYQMKLLGVDVHLKTEVTPEMVLSENPDVVVVATGSVPLVPDDIEGVNQDNVITSVRDVLTGNAQVGQNVLIVDYQRHIQGLSTADFLVQQGKNVQVVFPLAEPGPDMEGITQMALLRRLNSMGVKLIPHTVLRKIEGNTVYISEPMSEELTPIENIDTVILSYGGTENNSLYYALRGKVKELYNIGDSRGVRKVLWATNDGATLAREI
ncbi:MAG: FAD-dependent oxidoreductase [Dehalococcoidia bacterium]|nr:FAD-dependent oxidoreductase [Dehalococcoidia bacterium]